MATAYDAVIVGGRCAGAATAMLLARCGRRVLVIDRFRRIGNTVSTHVVKTPGVAKLARWGVLGEVVERARCPAVRSLTVDYGEFALRGVIPAFDGVDADYCPRRHVLDAVLRDAAARAGAEMLDDTIVDEVVWHAGRACGVRARSAGVRGACTIRAHFVVGADGYGSRIARAVGAALREERPAENTYHYAYWSGLPLEGGEIAVLEGAVVAAYPTDDGLACVLVGRRGTASPYAGSAGDAIYQAVVACVPALAERMRTALRDSPYRGTGPRTMSRRAAYGPGWALVGDAGLYTDPIGAQGISDAFRDAELLAGALDAALADPACADAALAEYERERDASAQAVHRFIARLAALRRPSAEMLMTLRSIAADADRCAAFVGMIEGTVPESQVFYRSGADPLVRSG